MALVLTPSMSIAPSGIGQTPCSPLRTGGPSKGCANIRLSPKHPEASNLMGRHFPGRGGVCAGLIAARGGGVETCLGARGIWDCVGDQYPPFLMTHVGHGLFRERGPNPPAGVPLLLSGDDCVWDLVYCVSVGLSRCLSLFNEGVGAGIPHLCFLVVVFLGRFVGMSGW